MALFSKHEKKKSNCHLTEEIKGLFLEQKNIFLVSLLMCMLERAVSQQTSDPFFELRCHLQYLYMEAEMNVDFLRPGRKL